VKRFTVPAIMLVVGIAIGWLASDSRRVYSSKPGPGAVFIDPTAPVTIERFMHHRDETHLKTVYTPFKYRHQGEWIELKAEPPDHKDIWVLKDEGDAFALHCTKSN
jgi:hypothetical protein